MSKDTGGPAFPSLNAECTGLDSDGFERLDTEPSGGMTLRDYFAAKAMAAMSSGTWFDSNERPEIARRAYALADDMLAARTTQQEPT